MTTESHPPLPNDPLLQAASGQPPAQLTGTYDGPNFAAAVNETRGLLMPYKFGLDELMTKINILREELVHLGEGSPIEHVSTRLKTVDSILAKADRMGCLPTAAAITEQIHDIAGIRIVCSFISDTYRVAEMLTRQPDITVVQSKDYIAQPKPNGYRSLHLIVEVPIFLSQSTRMTRVEVQIRTVAMDFWASMEHKIYYKFQRDIPAHLQDELTKAAIASRELDQRMQELRQLVQASTTAEDLTGRTQPVTVAAR